MFKQELYLFKRIRERTKSYMIHVQNHTWFAGLCNLQSKSFAWPFPKFNAKSCMIFVGSRIYLNRYHSRMILFLYIYICRGVIKYNPSRLYNRCNPPINHPPSIFWFFDFFLIEGSYNCSNGNCWWSSGRFWFGCKGYSGYGSQLNLSKIPILQYIQMVTLIIRPN